MNELFELMFIVFGATSLYLIISSIHSLRRAGHYGKARRIEHIRAGFATARNKLMHLAFNGKIAIDSNTFRVLNVISTHVMRSPSDYEEISAMFQRSFMSASSDRSAFREESKDWTPEVKNVCLTMADAMENIITAYSPSLHIISRAGGRFAALMFLSSLAERHAAHANVTKVVRETQRTIRTMAKATPALQAA